jgi:rhodanese-related sulfurtransferase
LAVGVRPDVRLANEAGLELGPTGAIAVNQYLQTSDPDIYAGGDCVENTHLLTGNKVFAPMGSTANKHGRVIGTNVTGGGELFPGVLGTIVMKVFDYNVGGTGLGEKQARDAGFDVITALVPAPDRAHYYPDARDILLKLISDRKTGRVLGGQAVGRGEVAKRIDVLATIISLGGTVDVLANLDLGYAPPYNAAMDPLHNAANVIRNKLSGLGHSMTPAQVRAKLDAGEDFILLDVRDQEEWNSWRIEAPQVKLVPQSQLRDNVGELSRHKDIVTLCRRGVRAYQAQRTLEGAGFHRVNFMEGSLTAWPYEVFRASKEQE